jgi:hypothetical protein
MPTLVVPGEPCEASGAGARDRVSWRLALALLATLGLLCSCRPSNRAALENLPEFAPGIAFTNEINPQEPWSVFVVRLARGNGAWEMHSTHAGGGVLGLSPLTEQLKILRPELGAPLAAVNGDFYQRDRAYAGDPRGLQIVEGELISAPSGTAAVWTDGEGVPHAANVQSHFAITWPDGATTKFGLNEERRPDGVVLFTPALGASTRTGSGRELVLERDGANAWLPLKAGETYSARVRSILDEGNTSLSNDTVVLSLGPAAARLVPTVTTGSVLRISTATVPDVRGAKMAISGGPILLQEGRRQKMDGAGLFDANSYTVRSMEERHPRSAVGWNAQFIYLMEVDGRHRASAGMTLAEVAGYLLRLGCTEAMNLDGGGSATFWCNGRVVNRPCDGRERPIANGLVVLRKGASTTLK